MLPIQDEGLNTRHIFISMYILEKIKIYNYIRALGSSVVK